MKKIIIILTLSFLSKISFGQLNKIPLSQLKPAAAGSIQVISTSSVTGIPSYSVLKLTGVGSTSITSSGTSFTVNTPTAITYTNGTGISITSGSIISNTAPDQTVSLTGLGSATVTGAYPTFSVNVSSSGSFVPYSSATGNVDLNSKQLSNVSLLTVGKPTSTTTPYPLLITDVSGTGFNYDTEPSIVTARLFTPTTSVNGHGFVNADVYNKNSGYSGSHNSFKDNSSFSGAGAFGHHSSYENNFTYSGSGTTAMSNAYGFYDKLAMGSGTVTTRQGFYFENATGSGVLTNQYGIYISTLSKGASINAAIYTQSNPSYFGGGVQLFSNSGSVGANTSKIEFLQGSFPGLVTGVIRDELMSFNGKIKISVPGYNFNQNTRKDLLILRGDNNNANTDSAIIQPTHIFLNARDINIKGVTNLIAITTPTTLVDGYFWNDGTNLSTKLNGSTQVILKGASGTYTNSATAATSFTVTLPNTQPNTTYQVITVPQNTLTADLMYVSSKTTTTFVVTFLAALTGTVSFDWIITQ